MNYSLSSYFKTFKATNLVVICTLAGLLFNCQDILEEDISNDLIQITNPLDGQILKGNNVTFRWQPLEGATQYAIQIYRQGLIEIDSVIESNTVNFSLESDLYQWRVRGQNFAYQTEFSFPQSFELTDTDILDGQTLQLTSPSDGFYANQTKITFLWKPLTNATHYQFELIKINSAGELTVFVAEEVLDTSLSLSFDVLQADTAYRWQVKAINNSNGSQTQYFSHQLLIDTTPPTTPILIAPGYEEVFLIDQNIDFLWNFDADTSEVQAPIFSQYQIATDEGFGEIILSQETDLTSFEFSLLNPGDYFWRVRGVDQAGNTGTYNLNGKFTISE